jgi:[FeFe] hydrogenase H-cluster maturation GTPase HydF
MDRLHIALVGRRNAGKSSLLNALTGQAAAIVSSVPGTTTDPVHKAMELPPLGPVAFVDTAGLDDQGELGGQRASRSWRALRSAQVVILVVDGTVGAGRWEEELSRQLAAQGKALLVAWNKVDLPSADVEPPDLPGAPPVVRVSAASGDGIDELLQAVVEVAPRDWQGPPIVADLLSAGDVVVLVMPQDIQAPRGRLILPQVQTIREILEVGATACMVKEDGLAGALADLRRPPGLVITDSQVFPVVAQAVPDSVPLTSFSVLFARHRGDIVQLVQGAAAVDRLCPGDAVLIAEACTHHPIGDDIGRVKIPRLLAKYLGWTPRLSWCAGSDFPEDLAGLRLVIHCGSCMLSRGETLSRLQRLRSAGVPAVNYGVLIAKLTGILDRALTPIPEAAQAAARTGVRDVAPPCRTSPT